MLCLFFNALAYDFSGEELKYELYWTIFHIADAKAEVERIDGKTLKFKGKVSTAGVARWFKRITDRGYSIWDEERKVPIKTYISQKEGDYVREKIYLYDLKEGMVTFIKRKRGRREQIRENRIPSLPFQDMISALYYFRRYGDFRVGRTTAFTICVDGKFYTAKVRVVSKERIDTPFGEVETFKCSPSKELSMKGSFERKGDVFVWFTADERHLPVKVVGKVRLGSVSAVLVLAKGKGFELKRRERSVDEVKRMFLEGRI